MAPASSAPSNGRSRCGQCASRAASNVDSVARSRFDLRLIAGADGPAGLAWAGKSVSPQGMGYTISYQLRRATPLTDVEKTKLGDHVAKWAERLPLDETYTLVVAAEAASHGVVAQGCVKAGDGLDDLLDALAELAGLVDGAALHVDDDDGELEDDRFASNDVTLVDADAFADALDFATPSAAAPVVHAGDPIDGGKDRSRRFRNDAEWWQMKSWYALEKQRIVALESSSTVEFLTAPDLTAEFVFEDFGVYVRLVAAEADLANLKCTGMRLTDEKGRALAMHRADVMKVDGRWMIRGRNANTSFPDSVSLIELDVNVGGPRVRLNLRVAPPPK